MTEPVMPLNLGSEFVNTLLGLILLCHVFKDT